MEMIMNLLGKIDVTAIVASAVTFILGIALVKAKLGKAISVIGDLADLLSEIKKSMQDGKLDKAELESILKEGNELIAEFKK